MRPRDSSSTDDMWSVMSLDELPDDWSNAAGIDDDDDDDDATTSPVDFVDRCQDNLCPQPSTTTTTTTTTTTSKTKSGKTKSSRSVVRRNERERNRVRQVNQGFDRLRQYVRLPGLSKKKLSKVDTLRAAVVYIKQLESLLAETDAAAAAAASAASYHVPEHLLPTQHQPHYQQQQPDAVVADVTNPSSGFFFLSLLQSGTNSPTETYDITASTSGLLATSSTPPEPALCAAYSTGSAWLPVADVNDNNYIVTEPCPPWSPEADVTSMADTSEQQRRLSDIMAYLMQ